MKGDNFLMDRSALTDPSCASAVLSGTFPKSSCGQASEVMWSSPTSVVRGFSSQAVGLQMHVVLKPFGRLSCSAMPWVPENTRFFSFSYGHKAAEWKELKTAGEVDVWALGVLCFGLLTGKFPFKVRSRMENSIRSGRERRMCRARRQALAA